MLSVSCSGGQLARVPIPADLFGHFRCGRPGRMTSVWAWRSVWASPSVEPWPSVEVWPSVGAWRWGSLPVSALLAGALVVRPGAPWVLPRRVAGRVSLAPMPVPLAWGQQPWPDRALR
jgi:hypothetical protein